MAQNRSNNIEPGRHFVTNIATIYCVNCLTIFTGKTVFYSVHYKNGCLAASELIHMFEQSIKFYAFHYHILKRFIKCDSSNGRQK